MCFIEIWYDRHTKHNYDVENYKGLTIAGNNNNSKKLKHVLCIFHWHFVESQFQLRVFGTLQNKSSPDPLLADLKTLQVSNMKVWAEIIVWYYYCFDEAIFTDITLHIIIFGRKL